MRSTRKTIGRVLAAAVLIAFAVCSLAACGGSSASTAKAYYSAPSDVQRVIVQGNKFTLQELTSSISWNGMTQGPPPRSLVRRSRCYWNPGSTSHGIIKNGTLYITSGGALSTGDAYRLTRLPGQLRLEDESGAVTVFTTQNRASWMHAAEQQVACGHW